MKKSILVLSLIIGSTTFSQNNGNGNGNNNSNNSGTITETTNGNIGIGTTTPSAKLDVNGTMVVDEDARFKKNTKIDGNTEVIGAIKGEQKLIVNGTAILNGEVKMPNLAEINNGLMNSGNVEILVKIPNGNIVKANINDLIEFVYAQKNCGPGDISNPVWHNGLNKIFTACPQVKVGVATANPEYNLDVRGTTYTTKLKVGNPNAIQTATINGFAYPGYGDLIQLGVHGNGNGNQSEVRFKITNDGTVILHNTAGQALISYGSNGNKILQLEDDGLLRARKIKVDLNNWADYVFNKNYNLMSLKELTQFIEINKHLPNVPSAKDVARKGLDLGDMQRIQMEKIEELTLYIIEQDKKIDDLQNQLDEIKNMLKK